MAIKLPTTRLLKRFCLFLGCKKSNATLEPIAALITLLENVSPTRMIIVINMPARRDCIT